MLFQSALNPGDEVIAFAPYFGEYRSYTNNYDGVMVEISPNTVDFQPKLDEFEAKITPKTKIVIVNTPNNPTGVVYSEETIRKLASIMEQSRKNSERRFISFRTNHTESWLTTVWRFRI